METITASATASAAQSAVPPVTYANGYYVASNGAIWVPVQEPPLTYKFVMNDLSILDDEDCPNSGIGQKFELVK